MVFDIAIIGAGVIGSLISLELSRYDLSICILEKENDAAGGSTKANSGIVHAGYDCRPGTKKAGLNVRGNAILPGLAKLLDVPYANTGSFVLAFNDYDTDKLNKLMDSGTANGVPGMRLLSRDEALAMEPEVSKEIVGALYAPTAGIVSPYELAIAAVETAVTNGAEPFFEFKVAAIEYFAGSDEFEIKAEDGRNVRCRRVVNAAGVYADAVAKMCGDGDYEIQPRKGEYMMIDRDAGIKLGKVVFMTPTEKGKGVLVTPTTEGNLMIGPNSYFIEDKEDTATTTEGLADVFQKASRSVPGISVGKIISSFAGNRATTQSGDFIIGPSKTNPSLINVIGIDSPGLTCAPAIAEDVRDMLRDSGIELGLKKERSAERAKLFKFREADAGAINEKIAGDPAFGHIVCRCEKVTEGEVVDAIRRKAGARTLDGIKFRTRAGMGRCQGGFCSTRLIDILARELDIDRTEVVKNRKGSEILVGKTK